MHDIYLHVVFMEHAEWSKNSSIERSDEILLIFMKMD